MIGDQLICKFVVAENIDGHEHEYGKGHSKQRELHNVELPFLELRQWEEFIGYPHVFHGHVDFYRIFLDHFLFSF